MADEGHPGAHTRADPPAIDQAAELGGRDPADLLAGSPDLEAQDLLAVAAELSAAPRRARGRPPGAANRKNADTIAYLQALGHRDPWVTLSLIQSADTAQLAEMLGAPLVVDGVARLDREGKVIMVPAARDKVLALQMRAAEAIMPYHHAKKPQQLDLLDAGGKRPVMVIGEMNVTQIGGDAFMSAGDPPRAEKGNEIKGEVVRQGEGVSHEEVKPLDLQDDSGESG